MSQSPEHVFARAADLRAQILGIDVKDRTLVAENCELLLEGIRLATNFLGLLGPVQEIHQPAMMAAQRRNASESEMAILQAQALGLLDQIAEPTKPDLQNFITTDGRDRPGDYINDVRADNSPLGTSAPLPRGRKRPMSAQAQPMSAQARAVVIGKNRRVRAIRRLGVTGPDYVRLVGLSLASFTDALQGKGVNDTVLLADFERHCMDIADLLAVKRTAKVDDVIETKLGELRATVAALQIENSELRLRLANVGKDDDWVSRVGKKITSGLEDRAAGAFLTMSLAAMGSVMGLMHITFGPQEAAVMQECLTNYHHLAALKL